jgi:hypothetical protein
LDTRIEQIQGAILLADGKAGQPTKQVLEVRVVGLRVGNKHPRRASPLGALIGYWKRALSLASILLRLRIAADLRRLAAITRNGILIRASSLRWRQSNVKHHQYSAKIFFMEQTQSETISDCRANPYASANWGILAFLCMLFPEVARISKMICSSSGIYDH